MDLDESMIRAIAKQAEAERERRAKVIHADGEYRRRKNWPRQRKPWPPRGRPFNYAICRP